jgi:uncharacterized protein YutE (UPF0331/DUF86 family)
MELEFAGVERRLNELSERLARVWPLREKTRAEFDEDASLRDIVERNLQVAAQCCIDISHRIISLENALRPTDYYGAILSMGKLGVLPADFARRLAPIAGLRNILVHDYVRLDWDRLYQGLQQLDDLELFADLVRVWLSQRTGGL